MNKYILPSTRSREFMNEIGKISNEFLSAWVNFVIVDLGRCHTATYHMIKFTLEKGSYLKNPNMQDGIKQL